MPDVPLPVFLPPASPSPAFVSTTVVQVTTNGVVQFAFDPASPNSTAILNLDPVLAEATEAALEAALAKAKAITAACKGLAGDAAKP